MSTLAADSGVELRPQRDRVVARLFLPGESTPGGSSRTGTVLERVLAIPPAAIAGQARRILDRFGDRHVDLASILRANAAVVRAEDAAALSDELTTVLGAVFTAEHAVEGAALCNPSAVAHPDQGGLLPGQLRVVLSLRSIGESHVSSLQFCEAVIGPGRAWTFLPRHAPLRTATISEGLWSREHLLRSLENDGRTAELARSLGQSLPDTFDSAAIEDAVQSLRTPILQHPDARAQLDAIRIVAGSAYRAIFPQDSPLSARVLLPVADEEKNGIEDARFVRLDRSHGDLAYGSAYAATYTAYDGHAIASRLVTTSDFREFDVHRLTGAAAQTKGMALFPRRVDGRMLALGRGDGESISLTRSIDGLDWAPEEPVLVPQALWEVVQSGNCGSPMETGDGWLVLTHGVGPMRVYGIGAILLDLDDPTRVIGILPDALVEVEGSDRDGYVPNVAYSCGGIIHDGILWVPHGVADDRIRVASVPVDDLLAAMRRT